MLAASTSFVMKSGATNDMLFKERRFTHVMLSSYGGAGFRVSQNHVKCILESRRAVRRHSFFRL
jgi:hypothetical protein